MKNQENKTLEELFENIQKTARSSECLDKKDIKSREITKDEGLKKFLMAIAEKEYSSKEDYSNLIKDLATIYSDGFRHRYSSITTYLIELSNEEKFQIITKNLDNIYKEITNKEQNNTELSKNIFKLLDHISLDCLRLKSNMSLKNDLEKAKKNLDIFDSKIKIANEDIKNSKRDYITILGIFAAIVLAFVAGISFSNSVLSNIHHASIYRLSFIICLIGLFITNLLYFLYDFIKEIHFGELYSKFKSFKNILIFDSIILVIIIAIMVCWCYNCVEYRNIENNITKEHNKTKQNSQAQP